VALSQYTVVADGSESNTFPINFTLGIFSRSYVTARVDQEVDGGDNPVYRALTWINDGLVTLGGDPITAGQNVRFSRTIPNNALAHDYSDGDDIIEENLDESNLQSLMLIHQALDGRIGPVEQDIDMNGSTLKNLPDPVDDGDPVPYEWALENLGGAAAEAAEAAQVAAEAARDLAEAAADDSEIARTAAEAAEDAAEAAQLAAEMAAIEAANKASRAIVHVLPASVAGGASLIVAPDGSFVSQSGSTTNGLQEAIDYCRAKGYNLTVWPLNGSPTDYMFEYLGPWITATAYSLQQVVVSGGVYYRCMVPHTSGTFATDLSGGKWIVFDYVGNGLGVPTGWPTIAGKVVNYRNTHYSMSSPLIIGPSQGMIFDLGAAVIAYTGTSGVAVTLDSAYQSIFKFNHIILSDSNTTGRGLQIKPLSTTGYLDGLLYDIPAFFHCCVSAMNLATASIGTVVGFEADAGDNAITECLFKLNEVEGGLAALRLVTPTGTGAIRGNTFWVNRLYGPNVSGNYALELGTSVSGGSVSDNKVFCGSIMPLHTGAGAVRIYGDANYVLASVINDEAGGDVAEGARFESSAANNIVHMPRCDAVTPVSDASSSTSNTYSYEGRFYAPQLFALNQQRFSAYKSSSTATSTTGAGALYTVVFDAELYDAGNVFDTSTGIFTAPHAGLYSLTVGLCLTGIVAAHTKIEVVLTTSARTYFLYQGSVFSNADIAGVWKDTWCLDQVLLGAGGTAKVEVRVSNGPTNTVGVFGGSPSAMYTFFSGRAL
jgi:hypothetical protein